MALVGGESRKVWAEGIYGVCLGVGLLRGGEGNDRGMGGGSRCTRST